MGSSRGEIVTVIVVDDDMLIRSTVSMALESRGLQVEALETGSTAFEAVVRTGARVVLLDVGLPGEDVFANIAQLRSVEIPPTVIIMSGSFPGDNVLSKVSQHFLMKPFTLTALFNEVERALDQ